MSLGLSSEERERLIFIKKNVNLEAFCYWVQYNDTQKEKVLIEKINLLTFLSFFDLKSLLNKQIADWQLDDFFSRKDLLPESFENKNCFFYVRYKYSFILNRDEKIITSIFTEVADAVSRVKA